MKATTTMMTVIIVLKSSDNESEVIGTGVELGQLSDTNNIY